MTVPVENALSKAAERKSRYYSLLYNEMRERRRAEEHLRINNALLGTLSDAQLRFVAGTELPEIFHDLLAALVEITQSEYALLGEFRWEEQANWRCEMFVTSGASSEGEATHDQFTQLLRRVAEVGKPVIVDGAESLANLFEESPPDLTGIAHNFLGFPFAINRSTTGIIGLANHPQGYTQATFALLQPVLSTCIQLMIASKNQQRRAAAEAALADERSMLARRVEERTNELRTTNAELARAVQAKDEFLATMNHELRTPLTAMLLFSESLYRQLYGTLNERQLRAVHSIDEGARHLLTLINDILDVAKVEAGKLTLELAPCDIESVCQASVRLVMELAHKKKIPVEVSIDPAIRSMVADERRLKQMLVNLLGNALKFTPERGAVGLQVTGIPEQNAVQFTVWDTGIGISADALPQLFKPFVQLDSGHSRQHGGSGLGLTLVSRMAEMHGGSVSVESEVGKGSQFTISLPWKHVSPPARDVLDERPDHVPNQAGDEPHHNRRIPTATFQPGPPAAGGAAHTQHAVHRNRSARSSTNLSPLILLAEDTEANIDALSDFLQHYAYQVIVARTGKEAIRKAREHQPDLILMDVQMPEMDGFQATQQIRADSQLQDIPIVALTALVMPGDRERCLTGGFDDYVSKPIHLEKLVKVINSLLHSRAAQRAQSSADPKV